MAIVHPMNRNSVDSGRVRRAFSRQAGEYDIYARVQKRVVERLLQRLERSGPLREPVLEIGCGTGELSRRLLRKDPGLSLVLCDLAHGMTRHAAETLPGALAVDAHAEALPLGDSRFGLVLSSSVYQWVDDLPLAFSESLRVLEPGGVFAFALFGGDTLRELRASYRRAALECDAGAAAHLQDFHTLQEVEEALRIAGGEISSLESTEEVERHADVPELLKHLKKIGAGNAARNRPSGMASRRVMQKMMTFYREEFGCRGTIPATYEVIYGFARRPKA